MGRARAPSVSQTTVPVMLRVICACAPEPQATPAQGEPPETVRDREGAVRCVWRDCGVTVALPSEVCLIFTDQSEVTGGVISNSDGKTETPRY